MSYALVFVRKRADQSWEQALDTLGDDLAAAGRAPDRQAWEHVRAEVARVLPEPSGRDGSGFFGLEDEATGIELSLEATSASITVPYWYRDGEAERMVRTVYALGAVIEAATGLVGFDPQVELSLAEAGARPELAVAVFNRTADSFRARGIWTPAND